MPALLSPWIPCILFAAVIIIGVPLLRLLAGDDPPDNAITHESGDGADGSQEDGPGALLKAA